MSIQPPTPQRTVKLHHGLKFLLFVVNEVFFVDATHPVQGFCQGQIWSRSPVVVRTSSGRQRVNILGTLNALRPELFSITGGDYVNAKTVSELIEFVRQEHPRRQLYLLLDNAKYQKCEWVRRYAKRHNVHLIYLPAYSPNLNLIERLWKFMKAEVLSGQYHATKEEFVEAIDKFIRELNDGKYKEELTDLLTTNFQTLEEPTQYSPQVTA